VTVGQSIAIKVVNESDETYRFSVCFSGMRRATDPDHVIAVTTTLSGEQRLVVAARVGIVC
jgi:hypothetical protein